MSSTEVDTAASPQIDTPASPQIRWNRPSVEVDTTASPQIDTAASPHIRRNRFSVMTGDSSLPETYHLDGGGNFGVWSYRMKSLLQKDDRFHYCFTPPSQVMGEEERMARQQVMSIINNNVKNSALKLLRRYSDPYECWTGLKARYESDSGPQRVMLLEKFFAMRKTESISMDTYLTEVREVANLLEEVEVILPEEVIVFYTLKNLPKDYEIFKRMQIAAQTLPTYEQLEAKLISEETALKIESQQKEDVEALLIHRDRNRRPQIGSRPNYSLPPHRSAPNGRWRTESGAFTGNKPFNHEDQGRSSATRYQPASNQRNTTSTQYQPRYSRTRGLERPRNEKCNFCGLLGHFERECDLRSILDRMKDYEHRLLEQRQQNLNGQVHHLEEPGEPFPTDQFPSDQDSADQIVNACLIESNLIESPPNSTSWYLDSGATHHVSGEQDAFTSIRSTNGAQVRSAGGHSHPVAEIGNVELQLPSGEIKSISSVLYTPGITKNLLSVGALTDEDKTLVFKSNGCFIFNNSSLKVEAFAMRECNHGLYRLSSLCHLSHPEVNLLHKNSQAELWHKRLGHFHAKGIQRMLHFGAVRGLPSLKFSGQPCTGCQLGKQAKTKIPKEATFQATEILQLIHSDVCGPFRTNSLGGARYFVTFIDDFSRKTWIYFLSHKSQVLTKFQHLVNLLRNSTGKTIQALRTDNGGEYTSSY